MLYTTYSDDFIKGRILFIALIFLPRDDMVANDDWG